MCIKIWADEAVYQSRDKKSDLEKEKEAQESTITSLSVLVTDIFKELHKEIKESKSNNPQLFNYIYFREDTLYGSYASVRRVLSGLAKGRHPKIRARAIKKVTILTDGASFKVFNDIPELLERWKNLHEKGLSEYQKRLGKYDPLPEGLESNLFNLLFRATIDVIAAKNKVADNLLTFECLIDPEKVKGKKSLSTHNFYDDLSNADLVKRVVYQAYTRRKTKDHNAYEKKTNIEQNANKIVADVLSLLYI